MATPATQAPHTRGGGAANGPGGEISITLASPDETAKVRIAVTNPDLVAEKVVSQLAKSFPPESVMTIAANNDDDVSSAADTTTGATDPESNRTSSRGPGSNRLRSSSRRKSPVKHSSRGKTKATSRRSARQQLDDIDEEEVEDHGDRRARQRRRAPAGSPSTNSEEDSSVDVGDEELTFEEYCRESSFEEAGGRDQRRGNQRSARPVVRSRGVSPAATALTQEYFSPQQLDYAIPITPGQSNVKLINDRRLRVDRGRCFGVNHDYRGLPISWQGMDGRRRSWAPSHYPGVGIKFQDYVVHPDLVYAVPITPGQREVSVSDGGALSISPDHVVTVFYDAQGRPAFTNDGRKRKIRPGLVDLAGIANHVRYYMLIDCNDGTGEQFVIPFSGFQKEVPNPFRGSGGKTMPIDRNNVTVVFYDVNRQPLYTQLADGSLLAGGLAGAPPPQMMDDSATTTSFDESEYISEHSASGGPMPRVKLHGDHLEITNYNQLSGVGAPRQTVRTRSPGKSSRNRRDGHTRFDSAASDTNREQSITSSTRRRQEIIERRVPVQQVQFVEKIVEVPEVHFVEKHVEVEKIEYETKIVKKKQIVERPVEHIKYVPKIETKIVERIIEVPEIIEVPRPEIIEKKVAVDRFVDEKQDVVVSSKLVPVIRESVAPMFKEIECLRLEPELVPVDVFVPKLVRNQLLAGGKGETRRTEVDVPLSHYNSLVLKLNPQYSNNYEKLPLVKTSKGSFPLLPADTKVVVPEPTDAEILSFLEATGLVGPSIPV